MVTKRVGNTAEIQKNVERLVRKGKAISDVQSRPPIDKDNMLYADEKDWSKTDLKGHWGDSVMQCTVGNKAYHKGWERIFGKSKSTE